jgi:hypothetical protein
MDLLHETFIKSTTQEYTKLKVLADKARAQLPPGELLFDQPSDESNSIAVVMKHVGGNLKSRWRDFLTSDGEKADRNRDLEFEISANDTEQTVVEIWEAGWKALFLTLSSITSSDLQRTVFIRNEPLAVPDAMLRSLAHTAYHVGQIVYLCKRHTSNWSSLSIPRGKSAEYNRDIGIKAKNR